MPPLMYFYASVFQASRVGVGKNRYMRVLLPVFSLHRPSLYKQILTRANEKLKVVN